MAVITIAEYARALRIEGVGGPIMVADESSLIAEKTYEPTSESAASDAFDAGTVLVRIDTDVAIRVKGGSISPTAVAANTGTKAGSKRMAADDAEYFGVTGGHKFAFILDA